jgi:hypothetical protein
MMNIPNVVSLQNIICAIDFGTSRSGYGYMLMNGEKVVNEQSWDDSSEPYCKTLTQLLYEKEKVIAWGFTAPLKMAEITEQADAYSEVIPPEKYVFTSQH